MTTRAQEHSATDPNVTYSLRGSFYEIYKDNDAMAVHKTLPHYKAWADFKARSAASFSLPSRLCRSSPRRGLALVDQS